MRSSGRGPEDVSVKCTLRTSSSVRMRLQRQRTSACAERRQPRRFPPKAEVRGSNPLGCASLFNNLRSRSSAAGANLCQLCARYAVAAPLLSEPHRYGQFGEGGEWRPDPGRSHRASAHMCVALGDERMRDDSTRLCVSTLRLSFNLNQNSKLDQVSRPC